jgi:hypothetical protein
MKSFFIYLTPILMVAGTTVAGGFQLPDGAADGAYVHIPNGDGTMTHQWLGEVLPGISSNASSTASSIAPPASTPTGLGNSARFRKRSIPIGTPQVNCKNQYVINLADLQTAEQGIEGWFGSGLTETQPNAYSYKSGSAVAYVCNYGTSVTVTGPFLQAQYTSIGTTCGLTSPGWVFISNWAASYGVDQSGATLCT